MIWPAAVTPFDDRGRIDFVSLARLLAFFEAAGCDGVVLAGTNGEGPSLAAVEKRDLLRESVRLRGKLKVILGLGTNSLVEAVWLTKRAEEFGATAALALPPSFFPPTAGTGLRDWYLQLMDQSPVPILVYHHPAMVRHELSPEHLAEVAQHPLFAGIKASSGFDVGLATWPGVFPDKLLLMGDESRLVDALAAGWSGSISGCANLIPHWLVATERDFVEDPEAGRRKLELLRPVMAAMRQAGMPSVLKGVLAGWRILDNPAVRVPLEARDHESVRQLLEDQLGMSAANLGLPRPLAAT
ncbi:MAG: dihydrodipicolinate synthase family protein [Chthonomonas sp.]|nr:dihydrodipicolinate synthase family protein [Chthonomonas sp.]